MSEVRDIFGNEWIITKRVDSGRGFDLIYGHPTSTHDPGRISVTHIIDTALERFVLKNMNTTADWNLPITGTRRGVLRRIISSRRYKDIQDWEENRDPSEPAFWVDADHITLPPLIDVHDKAYTPHAVYYFRPGLHIWWGVGKAPEPGRKRPGKKAVLTPELAAFLNDHAHFNRPELIQLGLPIEVSAVIRLRRQAIGYFTPTMDSLKAKVTPNQKHYVHQDYTQGTTIYDFEGKEWSVRAMRRTDKGDVLLLGYLAQTTETYPGKTTIPTAEIAALFDEHRAMGSNTYLSKRLGVTVNTITQLRHRLGQDSPTVAKEHWWAERMDDLLELKPLYFSRKHNVPRLSVVQMRSTVKMLLACAKGEKRGQAYIDALTSDAPTVDVAKRLGLKSPAQTAHHRKTLRIMKAAGKL